MMESHYNGYTILYDRNRAQAWKGEVDLSRQPDVDTSTFDQAVHIIDILEGFEEACRTGAVVPI